MGKLSTFLSHGCQSTPKKDLGEDASSDEEISTLVKNLSYPGKLLTIAHIYQLSSDLNACLIVKTKEIELYIYNSNSSVKT